VNSTFLKGDIMLHTKRLVIVLGLLIVAGCITQSSYTLKYDVNISLASLDGFRIQMSARMAQQIANEKGYKIDSQSSNVTFDDVVEAGLKEKNDLFLSRSGEVLLDTIRLNLSFERRKIYSIDLRHVFFRNHQQRAEELLDSYLKRYPQLVLSKEEGNLRVYTYKPNQFAKLSVGINTHRYSEVIISVSDFNYLEVFERAYR